MVKRKGFRYQVSRFIRLMDPRFRGGDLFRHSRVSGNPLLLGLVLLLAFSTWHPAPAFAQQPVAQQGQPLYPVNAKYVNGVAPGYWPTAGGGLTLNLSAGTANCGGIVTYAGGTLTMTASTTNYVYLNTSSSCAPAVNTTGFGNNIPIATVITSGSAIASITDVRTMFFEAGTGGAVTGISGTANEIASSGGAAPVISLANPFEDTYFAPANGNGSTNGIATAISACTTAGYPCNIFIPGTYPRTEAVPGEAGFWGANGTYYYGADTSPLVQVSDQRYGDFQTAVDPAGYGGTGYTGTRVWHQWEAHYQQAYGSPADLVEQLLEVNVINGGSNILTSSPSYSNKTSYEPFWADLRNHSKGQSEAANFTTECFGTGDCYPLAAIATYYGGRSANGDEGQAVIALKGYQGRTPYLNTVSSGGSTGSTSLVLGSPSQGIGTQGAGRYLLDCGTGVTGSDCATGSKVSLRERFQPLPLPAAVFRCSPAAERRGLLPRSTQL